TSETFRRELIEKIRALALHRRHGPGGARITTPEALARERRRLEGRVEAPGIAPSVDELARNALRPLPPTVPRVLLIGASTGGPQALNAMLAVIGPVIDQ